jgi:hypothetical protein
MTSAAVRNMGTTAQYAPKIKRATAVLSNERAVIMVPDTNRSDANGDDVTGTAKIHIYTSAVEGATPWTIKTTTPASASSSSTRAFVGSMINGTGTVVNNLYVVYQGSDSSIRLITYSGYNSSTDWSTVTEQTVAAGNAVTNRWRALDVSVTSEGYVVVAGYEAMASTGQGSQVVVYARNSDGTTWRKAHTIPMMGSSFIKAGGEDVSISLDTAGAISNVIKMAVYFTWTATTADNGDYVRELTYNVSTGTDGSATQVGNWYAGLNRSIAAGTRRGWLFSDANDRWILASSVGTGAPFFEGIKLQHAVFSGMVRNRISSVIASASDRRGISMFQDANAYSNVSAIYMDNVLVFVYAGIGRVANRTPRALLMRWAATATAETSYQDTTARFWDKDTAAGTYTVSTVGNSSGVVGVYAGINKRNNLGYNDFYAGVIYGTFGDVVSSTAGVNARKMVVVSEDALPVPAVIAPIVSTVPNDRPLLQTLVTPANLYSNSRWKVEWQLALDDAFTTDVRLISQSDSDYQLFNSATGATLPIKYISYQITQAQALYTDQWYIRTRLVDDLGTTGAWSSQDTSYFYIAHPPAALSNAPVSGSILQYGTGDVAFTWSFTDTESTDVQSAYQLIIERQDTGAIVSDTGKVTSSAHTVTINIAAGLTDIPLQWKIRLWDSDDAVGIYTTPNLFTLATPPTTSVTSPTEAEVVTTAIPTFTWSFASAGGYTQRAYRVIVYDTAPTPDESVADSGWVFSATQNHTFDANILENSGAYRVEVYVSDTAGMQGTDSNNFTTDWIEPAGATPTLVADTFKVKITWDDLAVDPDFVSWRVYRKYMKPMLVDMDVLDTANTWVLIDEQDDSTALWTIRNTNPYFETNATGWSSFLGTVARSTAQAHEGVASLLFTPDGSGTANKYAVGSRVPVSGNRAVRARGWIRPTTSGKDVKIFIHWYDAGSVFLESSSAQSAAIVDTWQFLEVIATPPTNATQAEIAIGRDNTPGASDTAYVDEVTLETQSWEYNDYTAPLNKEVRYMVAQMVNRFSSLIESNLVAGTAVTQTGNRYFFVPEIPVGSIASFEASSVNTDDFTDEVEQETLHVIGRGRQVQVGDDLGYSGSLTIRLRNPTTARQDREFFELLSSPNVGNVFMKSPFGDVLYIRLGNISSSRQAGMGTTDMADITVPYLEVFQEAQITRTV